MDWLTALISERVDHLLDATPDPTMVVDAGGVLRFVNERVIEVSGHPRDSLLGRKVVELVPGWDAIELGRLSSVGVTPTGVLKHRNGHTVPVEVSVVSLDGGDGYVIVFLRDISARLRLEQETDRLRDELIANISHELRTPLTSIVGYLELLGELGDDELGPQARRLVDIVARNARRELRLVNDLLAVSFVDEDHARMRSDPIDLGVLAKTVVEEQQVFAAGAGLEITLEAESSVVVRGDFDRLVRVLENLVVNSCKFTPPGGHVQVTVVADAANAVLTVVDTGIGVSESEQEKMFDRMYRAPGAVDRHIEGAGLGLSIAKAIIEAHSGTIAVTSAPNQGTTVRVVLPRSDQRVTLGGVVGGR